jgi:anti-sigma-K factor RskA
MTREKQIIDDELIANTVQSVRYSVPEALDVRVDAALRAEQQKAAFRKRRGWTRPVKWASAAAAVIVIAAALFLFQPSNETPGNGGEPGISEIKTELELAQSNIKIIWVQKKDFKLNKDNGNP